VEQSVSAARRGPAAEAAAAELDERLHAALARLATPYREPLYLSLLHGLGAAEIATALGRPAGTVRTQLVRGLELLRAGLPATLVEHESGHFDVAAIVALAATVAASFGPARHATAAVRAAVEASLSSTGAGTSKAAALSLFIWLAMKPLLALFAAGLVLVTLVVRHAGQQESSEAVANDTGLTTSVAGAQGDGFVVNTSGPVAQGAPRSPVARPSTPTAAATGAPVLLVNAVDSAGQPVPGALVITRPDTLDSFLGERLARADAGGTARFAGLAPGVWSLRELRGGALDSVEVPPQGETHAVIALPAGLRVEGLVIDTKSRPVAGASVWLPSGEREVEAWHVVTTTRGDGTFTLEHVAPKTMIGKRSSARSTGSAASWSTRRAQRSRTGR